MLQFVMQDLLEREDIERIKEVLKDHASTSSPQDGKTIVAIRKQLDQHANMAKAKRIAEEKAKAEAKAAGRDAVRDDEDNDLDEEPIDADQADEADSVTGNNADDHSRLGRYASGGEFGKEYNFKPFLASLKTGDSWEKAKKKARCSHCKKEPRAPWLMSCGHLICSEPCLAETNANHAKLGMMDPLCGICRRPQTYTMECDPDDEDAPEYVAQGTRSQVKRKTKVRVRPDREDFPKEWLNTISDEVLPSAKTIAVKAQIINWIKENPRVKIIVYTQFLAM